MPQPLAQQMAAFIEQGTDNDAEFNALALAVFGYQYENSPPLRRFWDAQQATPRTLRRWQDIPAVPVAAFKRFALSCVPETDVVAEFHSSGTTGANTSRHLLDREALALYEISLRHGYELALPGAPRPLWAVMPPPSEAPHSSLSHMLGALQADKFLWSDIPLQWRSSVQEMGPITLFGTAFALAIMLEDTDADLRLPPGSIVIETGGFKGRTREIERGEFYTLLSRRFGIPTDRIYSEYGMCEMASQFYGKGLDPIKRGPYWVRTRAIDPETGEDAPPGQPGLLRHLDLGNFNSALCLQTQDRGILTADGFQLLGRAPDAEVRGCSLTAEELWT